jgi:sialic acid synthase SpsE
VEFMIGSRMVGDGHPCFIVAEVGSNHDQDLDQALRLIDMAADSGVDAVKFQTFRAASHYSRKSPGFSYLQGQDTYSLIESLELDRTWQPRLMSHARDRGVEFFSSPCDLDALRELDDLGAPAHKLASFDLPDTQFISAMSRTGKPIILSTGLANWQDIELALEAMQDNEKVILLQCTSLYPAPAYLANLRAMASMRSAFGTLVGYSDHTMGDHVAIAAVALGACFLEKHVTLDRGLPGPDHPFAMEPDELRDMVGRIRDVEAGLGDGRKSGPRLEEREMATKGRRSLHASRDLPQGTVITGEHLVVKRPGLGISPSMRDHVIGRQAARLIEADEWITWESLQ